MTICPGPSSFLPVRDSITRDADAAGGDSLDIIAGYDDTAGIVTFSSEISVKGDSRMSSRFCTKSQNAGGPLFFIGCPSPAKAQHFARCMVSINTLRKRQSDFVVNDWILDSGAFSELSRFGSYRHSVEEYAAEIARWSRCGNFLTAVSQDYMCESFIVQKTGLTIPDHQRLTIERYDALRSLVSVPLMPVLQGFRISDYLTHLDAYGDRLAPGAWVGVGSVCRRNARPDEVADILRAIKNKRPDLRLHGFGLKLTALESQEVRECLHSSDSMAWSFPARFGKGDDSLKTADEYLENVRAVLSDYVRKRSPVTAGAGNGQGRKPKWNNAPTAAIRVPVAFAERLIEMARELDTPALDFVRNQGQLPEAIATYEGGKGQAGVYQKIINQIPPHDVYIEGCLGGGAVMRHKRPARISYGVEVNPAIVEEWRRVEFPALRLICGDVVKFLERFAWSGSELVYLDPPYVRDTRSFKGDLYEYEMTDKQHRDLLRVIKQIPARVILSGYWSEMYAGELAGWRTVSFQAVKRSGEVAEEWLWMNFPAPLELHDYRYLGEDFRERERIKRKRERWERRLREMPASESHAIMAALETVKAERAGILGASDDGR